MATLTMLVAPPTSALAGTTTSAISFTTWPTAKVGVYNVLSVPISTADGTTRPSGGVQFFTNDVQLVGSATTSAAGVAGATASVSGSSSLPITIRATPNGQVVAIAPQQMYHGIPTTLVTTVFPATLQGSVAFSVNELRYGTGPSVPVVNGSARQPFTPTGRGWQLFIVSFTATTSPGSQGATSQWVNVLPPLGTDDITLIPALTSMYRYQKGTLTATTVAGAPVTLTAWGGCTLTGDVLSATANSGTCVVTGTPPSTGGYLGTTGTWTIALTKRPRN